MSSGYVSFIFYKEKIMFTNLVEKIVLIMFIHCIICIIQYQDYHIKDIFGLLFCWITTHIVSVIFLPWVIDRWKKFIDYSRIKTFIGSFNLTNIYKISKKYLHDHEKFLVSYSSINSIYWHVILINSVDRYGLTRSSLLLFKIKDKNNLSDMIFHLLYHHISC
jgi:hypothetical protein